MKKMAKILSLVLSLCMVLSMVSVSALAAEELRVVDWNADGDFITLDFNYPVDVDSLQSGATLTLNGTTVPVTAKLSKHASSDEAFTTFNTYTLTPADGLEYGAVDEDGVVDKKYTLTLSNIAVDATVEDEVTALASYKKVFYVELITDDLDLPEGFQSKSTSASDHRTTICYTDTPVYAERIVDEDGKVSYILTDYLVAKDADGNTIYGYTKFVNGATTTSAAGNEVPYSVFFKAIMEDGKITGFEEEASYAVLQDKASNASISDKPYLYPVTYNEETGTYTVGTSKVNSAAATYRYEATTAIIRNSINSKGKYAADYTDDSNYTIKISAKTDASPATTDPDGTETLYAAKNSNARSYIAVALDNISSETNSTGGYSSTNSTSGSRCTWMQAYYQDTKMKVYPQFGYYDQIAATSGSMKEQDILDKDTDVTVKLANKNGRFIGFYEGEKYFDTIINDGVGTPKLAFGTLRAGNGLKAGQFDTNIVQTLYDFALTLAHEIEDVTVDSFDDTTFAASITNTGAAKNILAICAVYGADGTLVKAYKSATTSVTNGGTANITFGTVDTTDGATVRVFVWDGDTLVSYDNGDLTVELPTEEVEQPTE